ncbi:Folylpolyglutamate synthase [Galdieria sulphuraria]|uniref:Folylpolyglutamate synthase n=1 Tax=Galdieria sulphuraria TaxID=130081 RepID=M2Y092_GALSU|nr:folylpolyglutamate synthase [Galdieria sulphuraria]EME29254.1 folylpolyglutamate synthase [Galdieria sulphuraria]GJD05937.1 Folylpolyglutamate synthase [Galdieria sulphuraria]|eukprot:XP_005705774.1 folylpolyglutamate synthase [Galdieria sulphuraria]
MISFCQHLFLLARHWWKCPLEFSRIGVTLVKNMSTEQLKKEAAANAKLPPVFSKGPSKGTYSPKLLDALRRLDQWIDWERRDRIVGTQRQMRVNTGPIMDLLERLGNPHTRFQTVHITGSKGKGSVTSYVSAALFYGAGFSTGWYSSPHVERINERIGINDSYIEDDELAFCLNQVLSVREESVTAQSFGKDSTWFDLVTAAAFLAFARAKVEWAVVECGLGGKLDSTNVLKSKITVLTNVELEHAEIIGPTRKDIAREKAGIAYQGSVLITGTNSKDEAGQVIDEIAQQVGFRVIRPFEELLQLENDSLPLFSIIEVQNRCIAKEVLKQIGLIGYRSKIDSKVIDEKLLDRKDVWKGAKKRLPARMECFKLSNSLEVIIDGAHVPSSVGLVMKEITHHPIWKHKRIDVILGMGRDKHVEEILDELVPFVSHLYCTCVGHEGPYLGAEQLGEYAKQKSFQSIRIHPHCVDTLHMAIELIEKENACEDSVLLVIGSLHLAGALRPIVTSLARQE